MGNRCSSLPAALSKNTFAGHTTGCTSRPRSAAREKKPGHTGDVGLAEDSAAAKGADLINTGTIKRNGSSRRGRTWKKEKKNDGGKTYKKIATQYVHCVAGSSCPEGNKEGRVRGEGKGGGEMKVYNEK